MSIHFKCDYCGQPGKDCASHYKRKKNHFCKQACYAQFMKKIRPKEQHPRVIAQYKPIPFEKRFCPCCPGKQPLGHCWEPEFLPKDFKGTHPSVDQRIDHARD